MSELLLGTLSYVYYEQVEQDLARSLPGDFVPMYYAESNKAQAIDDIQERLKCCGALSYREWSNHDLPSNATLDPDFPDSCCITISENCGVRDHPSNIHYTV